MSVLAGSTECDSKRMRPLIWVPVVHSAEDLGSLADQVARRHGVAKWNAHLRNVAELWNQIKGMIEALELDFSRVRLYQDGLPVCDHEERIVRGLAEAGSANHTLLVELMARGARLTGTESPRLLLREFEFNRQALANDRPARARAASAAALAVEGQRLLELRDRFIASRIGETLALGETGLIFLGLLHSLDRYLARDISLTILRPDGVSTRRDRPT